MDNNILRIGGKDPSNKLRGIAVNDKGQLVVEGFSGSSKGNNALYENLPITKSKTHKGYLIQYLSYDGTAYTGRTKLSKTENFDVFEDVHTFSGDIDYVFKLKTGSLFVVLGNGEIWLSDENEENFGLVTGELGGQGHFTNTSRVSVYNNILLVGEYKFPGDVPMGNKMFISSDYGETYKISELPEQETPIDHIHSIIYDPYEQLIWVATGDSVEGTRIFWSKDFGESWETHTQRRYQVTTIMPLPNCVLFGTDSNKVIGTYKYVRRAEGVTPDNFIADLDFKFIYDENANLFGWTSHPSINYTGSPYALFGSRMTHTTSQIGTGKIGVWKTDGERYFSIWERDGVNSKIPYGVKGVYGPDKFGRVMFSWIDNNDITGYVDYTEILE